MFDEIVSSKEGFELLQKYEDNFGCSFRIEEPSGATLLMDIGGETYRIDNDDNAAAFVATIEESVNVGKNLLLERYHWSKVIYDDDMIY